MSNVVRFTLSTARDLFVHGVGMFRAGVLDIDANKVESVARARYLVRPYHAVEVGIVPAGTAAPTLPAVPAAPAPDPYPQYVTDADLANPSSGPSVALREAFVPLWQPSEAVLSNVFRLAPDGTIIQRSNAGTTRSAYDSTEAALWIVKTGAGGGSAYTDEMARDAVGAALRGAGGVTVTLDDAGDIVTIALPDGAVTAAKLATDVSELIRDLIGSTVVAGTNMTKTVDDAGDTVTLSAGLKTPPAGYVTGSPGVRRAMLQFGGASGGNSDPFLSSGTSSFVDRRPVQLPVATSRWRLRISQWNIIANGFSPAAIQVSGVWVGNAALAATGDPNGNFTAAPAAALGSFTTPSDGTEYVSAWVTDPTMQFQPNVLALLSLGWTSTSLTIAKGYGMWFLQKGVGASAKAGDVVPAGGMTVDGQQWFDMRLEYEYVGNQRSRLVIGDSLTEVYPGASNGASAIPPYTIWPQQAALRDITPTTVTAGSGRSAAQFASSSYYYWQRLAAGITMDDGLIYLGSNDAVAKSPLATFQANYAAVVTNMRTYVPGPIYAATVPPRVDFTTTTVAASVASGVTSITTTANPGTGLITLSAGQSTQETATVTATSGAGPYTLTLSAATAQAHNAGELVLDPKETCRTQYNTWLRTCPLGLAGIVDVDLALRDPAKPNALLFEVQGADGIHILRGGQARVANAVRMPVGV